MRDLIKISFDGIKGFFENFPQEEDQTKFPKISGGYFGNSLSEYFSSLSEYFSFCGFYKITKSNGRKIFLEKRPIKYGIDLKIKGNANLVLPRNVSDLNSLVSSGISLIKGKIYFKEFEGVISNPSGEKHVISFEKIKFKTLS